MLEQAIICCYRDWAPVATLVGSRVLGSALKLNAERCRREFQYPCLTGWLKWPKHVGKAEQCNLKNNARGCEIRFTRGMIMLWILTCGLNLLHHVSYKYLQLYFGHSGVLPLIRVCCVARCLTSASFTVPSNENCCLGMTHFSDWICRLLCFGWFNSVLSLFAFSAIASALQHFTH